jgi:hypothetical protein
MVCRHMSVSTPGFRILLLLAMAAQRHRRLFYGKYEE